MAHDIVIHPVTDALINAFVASKGHALLLEAPDGAGKGSLLREAAHRSGAVRPETIIAVTGTPSIGIDEIRELKRRLKLKGNEGGHRAVIIENAESMTVEAQNAFLKLLEEPPEDVVLLLSVRDKTQLLPTVTSRLTVVTVLKPDRQAVSGLFRSHTPSEVTRALALADGWPGMATALLSSESSERLNAAVESAKQLVGGTELERLRKIDQLSKNKQDLPLILFGLERILHSGLHAARRKGNSTEAWLEKLSAVEEAQTALRLNVGTRLILTRLLLSL